MEPNIATPAPSRKGLYIGIVVVLVLVVAGWMIMRGSAGPLGGIVPGADVDRNLDGSTTYSNDEGTVTVGGNTLPSNWPSDAPAYPNGTILYSGSTNPQTGTSGAAVSFSTQDSVAEITTFYQKELASQGWAIEQTATMGTATVLSATKDTRRMGVYIADAGETRTVTVGIELAQ